LRPPCNSRQNAAVAYRLSLILLLALVAAPRAQAPDPAAVQRILKSPEFQTATAFIRSDYDRFVKELITLTEIPAPPFKEERRAKAYLEMLRQHGLTDVEMDAEGNVMGLRRGTGAAGGPVVAVVAHLDTVFPEGTDVTVRREGTRLMAPGIGDDTRGLALILALIRAMDAGRFRTTHDILFAGSVGEEGEGDLRGVKFMFQKGRYKDRIAQFIAVDGGAQGTITTGGVGSRRYRAVFKGPGGHSYGAFGLVNPAYAMAFAIAEFSKLQVPPQPRTTFSIGVVRGGTSVNSIPAEVSMDVDMRSESCEELAKVDAAFHAIVKNAVEMENRARSTREGRITADPQLIGDRPCGQTPHDSPLVRTVTSAVQAFGLKPSYGISSTDSNVPMSLGIPAVTIGRGPGGRAHAPDEWVDVEIESAIQAVQVAMTIVLAVAEMRK
jgi:tripeptide aminopeptidase